MRRRYLILFLTCLLVPFAAAAQKKTGTAASEATPAANLTGKEIFEEIGKRHGRPIEFEIQKMTLTDDKGNKHIRDLKRYARAVGPGEQRFLMVFHSPPEIRGASVVTWERRFKKDGQWIYFPANGGDPMRIVNGGKKNYVMGTDFTSEDLASEPTDKLAFKRLKDEVLNGKSHFVIDVTPKDSELQKETGYKLRRIWVDKENYFLMRTDYYDWRDTLIKRQTVSNVKKIEDDTWRADSRLMENFEKNHKTRIEVIERSFEESSVPLDLFFQRTLTSGDHIR